MYSERSTWHQVGIGSGNGSMPNRQQALSVPILTNFIDAHICVIRPRWVNMLGPAIFALSTKIRKYPMCFDSLILPKSWFIGWTCCAYGHIYSARTIVCGPLLFTSSLLLHHQCMFRCQLTHVPHSIFTVSMHAFNWTLGTNFIEIACRLGCARNWQWPLK